VNKKSLESSIDDSEIIEKISKKYFSEIEYYVPHLQQSLFDFQNEFCDTWKNFVNSNISLYNNFGTQSGLNSILSKPSQKLIEDINNEIIQYRSMYHKIIIKSIESGKENVKVWNDNAKIIDELNEKAIKFWSDMFSQKSADKTTDKSI